MRGNLAGQRLAVVFIAGMFLFNYPVLSLFDRPIDWLGMPIMMLYLFGVWLLVIVLMAWVVELGERQAGRRR